MYFADFLQKKKLLNDLDFLELKVKTEPTKKSSRILLAKKQNSELLLNINTPDLSPLRQRFIPIDLVAKVPCGKDFSTKNSTLIDEAGTYSAVYFTDFLHKKKKKLQNDLDFLVY